MDFGYLQRRWTRRRFNAAISRADAARDSGHFGEAAEAYAAAFALDKRRVDLRVQRANMLKDKGDFALAEEEYLVALAAEPNNPDIQVQLGHLRSLLGRRTEALANYSRALELDPGLEGARRALVAAGDVTAQNASAESLNRAQGLPALASMSFRLATLAEEVASLRERLPDLAAFTAFPLNAYENYRALFDCQAPPEDEWASLSIGVVVQADAETLEDLHRLLAAMSDQSHANWRLLALGCDGDRRDILLRATTRDSRFAWRDIGEDADPIVAEHASGSMCGTDLVLLLARGALPHRHALAWIAATHSLTGCLAMVFDEETGVRGAIGGPLQPLFRQTVDRDTLFAINVYGETLAVATSAMKAAPTPPPREDRSFARSLLLLDLCARGPIAHVPLPLFRTPHDGPPISAESADAHRRALAAMPGDADVTFETSSWSPLISVVRAPLAQPDARISIIIPTRDNAGDLWPMVESLVAKAGRPDVLEIIILNNGVPASIAATSRRLRSVTFKVIEIPEPFNWSRFNNLAAEAAGSPYLVFANDDMCMLSAGWDDTVRRYLERDEVGALGAKLLYPDETIQHAGVLFGWRGSTIHDGLHRAADDAGPALRWVAPRAVGAVTGAFLATRKEAFSAVGGFDDTHLAISYSDVDYALKLRARDLQILWTPAISLYHFESKSRGLDHLEPARRARDATEREIMRGRWGSVLDEDPSLNPHWRDIALPHQFLASPALNHVLSHILRGAARAPWRVATSPV